MKPRALPGPPIPRTPTTSMPGIVRAVTAQVDLDAETVREALDLEQLKEQDIVKAMDEAVRKIRQWRDRLSSVKPTTPIDLDHSFITQAQNTLAQWESRYQRLLLYFILERLRVVG